MAVGRCFLCSYCSVAIFLKTGFDVVLSSEINEPL